jgi:hypothetical protein
MMVSYDLLSLGTGEFHPLLNNFNNQLVWRFDQNIKYKGKKVELCHATREKLAQCEDRHKEEVHERSEDRIAIDELVLTGDLANPLCKESNS